MKLPPYVPVQNVRLSVCVQCGFIISAISSKAIAEAETDHAIAIHLPQREKTRTLPS